MCAAGPAAAGYDEGVLAYNRGDFAMAYDEFLPLARNGDTASISALGALYIRGAGVVANPPAALALFRRAAEKGHAEAIHNLGLVHLAGAGVAANPRRAAELFRRAARAGLAAAQYRLGLLYRDGIGVAENHAEATRLITQAAEQGHLPAQLALGELYRKGARQTGETERAAEWYRRAAENGDADAQYQLAELLRRGTGGRRDPLAASGWYLLAARAGHVAAQNALGEMYAAGDGVEPDVARAVEWHRKAAEAGDPDAQTRLGVRLMNGEGVARDATAAASWFRRAAEQGYGPAQMLLAQAYLLGQGVDADAEEARRWFAAASVRLEDPAERDKAARLAERLGGAHAAAEAEHAPRTEETTDAEKVADPAIAPPPGDLTHKVALVQQMLADLGFDPGPVDGVLGPQSERAFATFRTAYRVDGLGPPDTAGVAALYNAHAAHAAERTGGKGGLRRRLAGGALVVARDGRALAALEVVEGCQEIRLLTAPAWRSSAGEVAGVAVVDRRLGLALIATPLKPRTVVSVAASDPAGGAGTRLLRWPEDDVLAMGPRTATAPFARALAGLAPGDAVLDAGGALIAFGVGRDAPARRAMLGAFLAAHGIETASADTRDGAESAVAGIECWE